MSKLKTSPFSIQTNAYESFSKGNVKHMRFYSRGLNRVNSFLLFSTLVLSLIVAYLFITINQLEKVVYLDNLIERLSQPQNIIQVSETESVNQIAQWQRQELIINNNVAWSLELPDNFSESLTSITEGLKVFNGVDSSIKYRMELEFPLFTNYPGGVPVGLTEWVLKENSYYSDSVKNNLTTESFNVDNLNVTLVYNAPRTLSVNNTSKEFDSAKSVFILYIDKSQSRNFSKITFIPDQSVDVETTKAFVKRVATSLRFNL